MYGRRKVEKMPDFSMCVENNCKRSKDCRRHADSGTKPCSNQAWGASNDVNDCKYYMPTKGDKDVENH
jgi:hypothetical protein